MFGLFTTIMCCSQLSAICSDQTVEIFLELILFNVHCGCWICCLEILPGPPSENPGPWAERSRALSYRALLYRALSYLILTMLTVGPARPLKVAGPLGICPPCPPLSAGLDPSIDRYLVTVLRILNKLVKLVNLFRSEKL